MARLLEARWFSRAAIAPFKDGDQFFDHEDLPDFADKLRGQRMERCDAETTLDGTSFRCARAVHVKSDVDYWHAFPFRRGVLLHQHRWKME